RRKAKPALDEFEYRHGLVLVVVDNSLPDEGRDDDGGNADANSPTVRTHRRDDVGPTAAVLVLRHDDDAGFPDLAVLHGLDQVGDVLLAGDDIGVARVLVVLADRLDESDRRQFSGGDIGEEIGLVLQMCVWSCGRRVQWRRAGVSPRGSG